MSFTGLRDIADRSMAEKKAFWEIVLDEEVRLQNEDPALVFEKMRGMLLAMRHADESYDPLARSGGLGSGGDGEKLRTYRENTETLCGDFLSGVMEKAVKMGESNACMKRIVAAPTAGSCGVLPAVLLTYQEKRKVPDSRIVEALFTASGIGQILAQNASISGAEGGCQAEIGSASAMTAGAVVYLEGGGAEEILNAAAIALKSMLGLVCDPVAGLVEVPCIKRNVSGAVNAVTAAQMVLSGIRSRIPADQVIDCMYKIGLAMPAALRETAEGGLAATPAGRAFAERLQTEEFSG